MMSGLKSATSLQMRGLKASDKGSGLYQGQGRLSKFPPRPQKKHGTIKEQQRASCTLILDTYNRSNFLQGRNEHSIQEHSSKLMLTSMNQSLLHHRILQAHLCVQSQPAPANPSTQKQTKFRQYITTHEEIDCASCRKSLMEKKTRLNFFSNTKLDTLA